MTVTKLEDVARVEALGGLPLWAYDADARGIRRSFSFADFGAAFAFMTHVAILAERPIITPNGSTFTTASIYC